MNLGERDAFIRGFSLAVRLMVEVMSGEIIWRALFRPVSREKKNGACTRPRPTKPTQAVCRGLWAKKHRPAECRAVNAFCHNFFRKWFQVVISEDNLSVDVFNLSAKSITTLKIFPQYNWNKSPVQSRQENGKNCFHSRHRLQLTRVYTIRYNYSERI